MGRRTWIKIYSEKWLRGSIRGENLEVRAVFIDLLALAGDSAYGDDGIIRLAPNCGFTDEQICKILNINDDVWIRAKKRLCETGRITVNAYNEIKIVNWKKYQSEYARQKEYRKKKEQKVTTESYNSKLQEKLQGERERDIEREREKKENINNNNIYTSVLNRNDTVTNSGQKKVKAKINFNFETEEWENIRELDKQKWKEAYPACDIEIELNQMREWLLSNPNKRKKNYRRFITNWLTRSQEKGGTKRKEFEELSPAQRRLRELREAQERGRSPP